MREKSLKIVDFSEKNRWIKMSENIRTGKKIGEFEQKNCRGEIVENRGNWQKKSWQKI